MNENERPARTEFDHIQATLHDPMKDLVATAVRKAVAAVEAAQKAAYEDVRTSSTVCTDQLDAALAATQAANQWYQQLRLEERAAERAAPAPRPAEAAKPECHICEEEIQPDDVAVCGGCDQPTCPVCMGDGGICSDCEAED